MSLVDRVKTLQDKHADLERVIEEENGRPMPDTVVLHDFKRKKLAIKDEIEKLTHP